MLPIRVLISPCPSYLHLSLTFVAGLRVYRSTTQSLLGIFVFSAANMTCCCSSWASVDASAVS